QLTEESKGQPDAKKGHQKEIAWPMCFLSGGPRSRLRLQGLHAPALHRLPHRSFNSGQSLPYSNVKGCGPRFEDHTWQANQYDLNLAYLIEAAARSIHVLDPDA